MAQLRTVTTLEKLGTADTVADVVMPMPADLTVLGPKQILRIHPYCVVGDLR